MNSSSWIIMAVAFTATVMLVLALYPVVASHMLDKELQDFKLRDVSLISERRCEWTSALFTWAAVLCILLFFHVHVLAALFLAVIVGVLCWLLLYHIFSSRRHRRDALFEIRMLDFLVLVSNNLHSGFALPVSIEMAARSVGGALEAEFNMMLSEYRLGIELSDSIRRMTVRVKSENLQLFAATISIAIQTGSSIASVLERLIYTMRKRNEMTDKLKAASAQFRFEAFVMSFFPFIAFAILYYLDPKTMRPMVTTTIGWVTLGAVVLLEVVGLQILKKICRIKM